MALKSPIQVIPESSVTVTTSVTQNIPSSASGGKYMYFSPVGVRPLLAFGIAANLTVTLATVMCLPSPLLLNLNGQVTAERNAAAGDGYIMTPLENH